MPKELEPPRDIVCYVRQICPGTVEELRDELAGLNIEDFVSRLDLTNQPKLRHTSPCGLRYWKRWWR